MVVALVSYALRQNISLYYTPSQIQQHAAPYQRDIRVGGMVVKGSIYHLQQRLGVRFQISDFHQVVQVYYRGILPDLFREGQGIVVKGQIQANGVLKATEVLAKHDENYMPAEVKASLQSRVD